MVPQESRNLLYQNVFHLTRQHSPALVLGPYLLYPLIIRPEKHVQPLERNINIRITPQFSLLSYRRLSVSECAAVALVLDGLVIVVEIDVCLRPALPHLLPPPRP